VLTGPLIWAPTKNTELSATFTAEFCCGQIIRVTLRTAQEKSGPAFGTEFLPGRILGAALWAVHIVTLELQNAPQIGHGSRPLNHSVSASHTYPKK
jgi:hypothetical protein